MKSYIGKTLKREIQHNDDGESHALLKDILISLRSQNCLGDWTREYYLKSCLIFESNKP